MDTAHNTGLYFVGTGVLYFDRHTEAGLPTGLRDLGNATSFTLGVTIEKKEHTSFRESMPTVDLEMMSKRKLTGKFTLDEYDVNNLKMFLMARTASFGVAPFTTGEVMGELSLVGQNSQGAKYHVQLWKVRVAPGGDLTFIGEDWGAIPFDFTVEADVTGHPNDPYGKITPIGES